MLIVMICCDLPIADNVIGRDTKAHNLFPDNMNTEKLNMGNSYKSNLWGYIITKYYIVVQNQNQSNKESK